MQKISRWWEKTAAWEEWRRWQIKRMLQHTVEASVRRQKSFHTLAAWLFRTRKGDWPVCLDSIGNPMGNNPDPLSLLTHPLPSPTTLPLRDWALQSIQSPQSWNDQNGARRIYSETILDLSKLHRLMDSWLDPLCAQKKNLLTETWIKEGAKQSSKKGFHLTSLNRNSLSSTEVCQVRPGRILAWVIFASTHKTQVAILQLAIYSAFKQLWWVSQIYGRVLPAKHFEVDNFEYSPLNREIHSVSRACVLKKPSCGGCPIICKYYRE